MFNTGEYVVYKNNVCFIKKIKRDDYLNKDCYILKPVNDESLVIQVPVEDKKGFIKKIIPKKEAIKLLDSISKIDLVKSSNKITEVEYKNLLNTNNKEDLIRIIKTAYLEIDKRKKVGKKEREVDSNYLEKSLNLLCVELSISLEDDIENIKNFILEKLENA